MMGMCYLKIFFTSQAYFYRFFNLKKKLYNCNANIFFNQECLQYKIIPNYAKIKIPYTSKMSNYSCKIYNFKEQKTNLNLCTLNDKILTNNCFTPTLNFLTYGAIANSALSILSATNALLKVSF